MKKFVFSFILICGALAFILSGCKGDAGPAGLAGLNGTDGTNGVDGNITCLACHSGTVKAAINAQFATSQHALGDIAVAYAGGRASCAQCHSHEGYVEWATFGSVANDFSAPTAFKCSTCHGLHSTFDSTDYAFRAGGAITLLADGTTMLDEGNNNVCINCHQTRRDFASYDVATAATYKQKFTSAADRAIYATTTAIGPNGSVTVYGTDSVVVIFDVPTTHEYISSTHAGGHHGPQGNLWYGNVGATLGSMYAPHKDGCVACHMAAKDHSFAPKSATCIACHADGTDKQGDLDDFEDRIHDVGVALEAIHAVHYDATDGAWHPLYASLTNAEFAAWWNFMVCLEDRSNGAHNPNYVDALLDAAETALGI
ncbi:MAG: hypothetical protein K9J13_15940 [Saprospiraceae bacterium]|nr:hypothetical protein [Saprospiraceae bacterium]